MGKKLLLPRKSKSKVIMSPPFYSNLLSALASSKRSFEHKTTRYTGGDKDL
jgi:hypothetical protein